jgi:hypothetical protein
MTETRTIETAKSGAVVVGVLLGALPFPAHAFDFRPLLSPTARLPDPLWWVVSLAVCVCAATTYVLLERARRRVGR